MELFRKLNAEGHDDRPGDALGDERGLRHADHPPAGRLARERLMAASDLAPSRPAPASPDVLAKARILLADDQPDVLEALRLLLKARATRSRPRRRRAGVLRAVDARDFDAVADGSELHARHHVGPGRARPALADCSSSTRRCRSS